MEVALVNPKMFIRAYQYFPIGLGYIAAALEREELSYTVYDLHQEWQDTSVLIKALQQNRPDILGISGLLTSFPSVQKLCAELKSHFPELVIVVGGRITVMEPEFIFNNIQVDFIIRGEGEKAIVDLIAEFRGQKNFHLVEGLAFKGNDGDVVFNGEAKPVLNINDYVVPYHKFEMAKYIKFCNIQSPNVPSINMLSSRGCPFSCTFCNNSKDSKSRMRFYDIAQIEKNLDYMIDQYDLQHVTFNDDIFTVNKEHFSKMCDLLKSKKLTFSLSTRLDFLNEDRIKTLDESGCHYLCVGIESPAPAVAAIIDKKLDLEKFGRNIEHLKKSSIVANYGFMIGYVGETEETIQQTRDFVLHHKIIYSAFFANAFPNTKLFDMVRDKIPDPEKYLRRLFTVDLSRDYLVNMTELPIGRIFRARDQLVADSLINTMNINNRVLKGVIAFAGLYYLTFMRKYGLSCGFLKRLFEFVNMSIIKPLTKGRE